jgi:hypothetical protein
MARGFPTQVLGPDPRSAITLDYVCGKQFRIRNALPKSVNIQYEVVGDSVRKRLTLPANRSQENNGELLLDVSTSGELRLLLDGDVFLTRANGGTAC